MTVTPTLKMKTPKKSPDPKSVKFGKASSLQESKKKYIKTPHSSKTPFSVSPVDEVIKKKERKLSFTDAENAESPLNISKAVTPIVKTISDTTDAALKKASTSEETLKVTKAIPVTTRAIKRKKSTPEEVERNKVINTVFVGNLPGSFSKEDVKKLFSKIGGVQHSRFRCAALLPEAKSRKAGTILKQVLFKSAFVRFSEFSRAKAALKMNGKIVKGHHIRVDLADPQERGTTALDKNKAIYLRNLHYELTDDELWEAFSSCGKIVSVRILKDRKTYHGNGGGFINFESPDSVELALKMDGAEIKGRPVSVRRWESHPSNSFENKKGGKKGKKVKSSLPSGDAELIPSSKRLKKKDKSKKTPKENDNGDSLDFSGNKAMLKKKKKKKISHEGMKKKKIAQILTK